MIFLAVIMCILGSLSTFFFLIKVLERLSGTLVPILLFLFLLGGYIGVNVYVGKVYGAPGVAIFNIVGIILGIIFFILLVKDGMNSSSSSSSTWEGVSNILHKQDPDYQDKYKY